MVSDEYDFVVIGAGAAGLKAAEFAARLGARVALLEKRRLGGDCTWTGCVPSKALLHIAKLAHGTRVATASGILTGAGVVDMKRVRAYIQGAIGEVTDLEMSQLSAIAGLDVIEGAAQFLDANIVQAGERILTARRFLIATGARPMLPEIRGLADVTYHTHETIFANGRLPEHLIVLGAGPIGAELAQAYARLGSHVTIVDVAVLPNEEPAVQQVMSRVFERDGIEFVHGLATTVSQDGRGSIAVQVEAGGEHLRGDLLLLATGRAPSVFGLGLESAGVEFGRDGIHVDDYLRTSVRHIYAAGDCLGGPQFTHLAAWQGYKAARNALLPGASAGKGDVVPQTTYTDPEIARVGLSTTAAREKYDDRAQVTRWDVACIDRAITDGARDGFIDIIHLEDGTLLGATIVAANAGELIAEFVLGLRHDLKVGDLAGAIHAYPTFSIGTQMLAAEIATESFLNSVTGKLVRRLSGYSV